MSKNLGIAAEPIQKCKSFISIPFLLKSGQGMNLILLVYHWGVKIVLASSTVPNNGIDVCYLDYKYCVIGSSLSE